MSGHLHVPAALNPGIEPPASIGWENGWDPRTVWTRWGREIYPRPSWEKSPSIQLRVYSLHWLRLSGPSKYLKIRFVPLRKHIETSLRKLVGNIWGSRRCLIWQTDEAHVHIVEVLHAKSLTDWLTGWLTDLCKIFLANLIVKTKLIKTPCFFLWNR